MGLGWGTTRNPSTTDIIQWKPNYQRTFGNSDRGSEWYVKWRILDRGKPYQPLPEREVLDNLSQRPRQHQQQEQGQHQVHAQENQTDWSRDLFSESEFSPGSKKRIFCELTFVAPSN